MPIFEGPGKRGGKSPKATLQVVQGAGGGSCNLPLSCYKPRNRTVGEECFIRALDRVSPLLLVMALLGRRPLQQLSGNNFLNIA